MEVEKLWVQYGYDDTSEAPIIQTANTKEEATEEDELVMSGCCWYCYDVGPGNKLINEDGPHYLTTEKKLTR